MLDADEEFEIGFRADEPRADFEAHGVLRVGPAGFEETMDYFGHNRIKWTYATHRVDRSAVKGLVPMSEDPDPGRVVLGRVVAIGRHKEVEGTDGRKLMLFPGDVLAGTLAYRYATDQYEGLPISSGPAAHLLSIGGVCGYVASKNEKMLDPTTLEWIGTLADAAGQPLRLRRFALRPPRHVAAPRPRAQSLGSRRRLPDGCTTVTRAAPSPHATVRPSSSIDWIWPGATDAVCITIRFWPTHPLPPPNRSA